ncbi:RidA family protein [Thermodesulfobacteriota bacterium]
MEKDDSKPRKMVCNPPGTERISEIMQFSQAIRVGDILWVSGQVGVDKKGVTAEGIEAQARIAFESLEAILKHAGSSMADVVDLMTFHKSMDDMRGFSNVKSEFFPDGYPAWTAVGVTELAMPDLLVEVKATAVVGCGENEQ